jgi:hypothetical protein
MSKVIEGHLSFKKILHNTFIYELILIKIYMKTIIMNMQIFHFSMISRVIECHKRSSVFLGIQENSS